MDNLTFKKRILFIGVPDMAYIGLDTLCYAKVNIVGVMGPLKTHNTYYYFKNFVKMRNLNFIEYDNLNDTELIETIKDLNIDLAVVCSFNNKIPKVFLDSIKDGILNIHPSLLPQYRGGNPYSRVLMNGEKQTGVTIHFMSENFDEGDIVRQEVCDLDEYETMGTIFHKTNRIGCKLLLSALIEYEQSGTIKRQKQPDGIFIKAPNVKDAEMIINYNSSAAEIDGLVRGLNPYMSATTFFNDQVVKMFKVKWIPDNGPEKCQNGEIYKIENNNIYVKTANGTLLPKVMQYSGYFIGDTEDFIRIVKPKIGDKFNNG
ncbi:MAG: methionyl-tRNA formyltransferase [Candidatus Gastranaerophilales bacterium]|nr:methionyl-tRNA formyltransferase [Candidatus Gastranaerophilales bacterium]